MYAYRAVYSPTTIPAMLHACCESRQIALEWYNLAFRWPGFTKPRVYFDFGADYLRIGCGECEGHSLCMPCQELVSRRDARSVKKILLRHSSTDGKPFLMLYLNFRNVKEVLLYDPLTDPVKLETQLDDLRETSKPFSWQSGKALYDTFLDEKGQFDRFHAESLARRTTRLAKYPGLNAEFPKEPFCPKKITRVEVATTPKTSKVYGFLGEQFKASSYNFSFQAAFT